VESTSGRAERDEFRARLKRDCALLWSERFDDRVRAEGISVRDYLLLLCLFALQQHCFWKGV
jgi:hypothetical protein